MGFHLGLVGIRRPCAAALFSNPQISPPASARRSSLRFAAASLLSSAAGTNEAAGSQTRSNKYPYRASLRGWNTRRLRLPVTSHQNTQTRRGEKRRRAGFPSHSVLYSAGGKKCRPTDSKEKPAKKRAFKRILIVINRHFK